MLKLKNVNDLKLQKIMEDLIKKIKEMQPTKEQLEGRTPEYAFGYVDALNEAVKLVNVTLGSVSKSLCDVCGSNDVANYPHVGFTCYNCNPM